MIPVVTVVLGDADGDGKTNSKDLAVFQRYLAKWTGYGAESVNVSALDLDSNGKVNALDAAILARYIAKWLGFETLPYKK